MALSERVPAVINVARRWHGVLVLQGDAWPVNAPVWQCAHRHKDEAAALECAEAELQARALRSD